MTETLLVHESLCSVTQENYFGRPPVSICLTLERSLHEEQIPGETLMIARGTRVVLDYIRIRITFPFHLGCHWCRTPLSRTGICYGH